MKKSFFILPAIILYALTGFSQNGYDSIRTRNDKPGNPQSLRTPNQAPHSHVTIINTNVPPNQNVLHTSSESVTPNYTNGKTIITSPNTNGTPVPKTSITLQSNPGHVDTIPKNPINNKVSNSSNPLRNQ